MGAGAGDHNGGRAAARRRAGLRGAALALAAAGLAGCAGGAPESGPIAQAPEVPEQAAEAPAGPGAGGRVVAGSPAPAALLLPLGAESPSAAQAARDMADAARLALAQRPGLVALEVIDTGGTAEGAAAAARRAEQGGAAVILGPLFRAGARAAGEAAAGGELNVIGLSNTPSAAGGNVWLAGSLAGDEADRILGHAAREGVRRIGVWRPDSALGEVAEAALRDAAPRHGVRLGPVLSYPRSFEGIRDDAEAYVAAHRAAGAQAALLPDFGQGLTAAASFLRYNDIGTEEGEMMLGLGTWGVPAMARETSLRGGRFAAPDPERLAAFAEAFEAEFGREPDRSAWLGYDVAAAAAEMAARGRREGDERPFGRDDILDPRGFPGAAGPFRFTEGGLNRRMLAVVAVGAQGFEVVEPAPAALPGPGA
jgi:hypothetical protein